jgi:tetratricopeptide (TPR) repeat protein
MQIMNLKTRQEFNKLYESGVRALNQSKPEIALNFFVEADELASHSSNNRRLRLNALNPLANSLWSMGEYEKAKQKLALASSIASDLALRDELAKAFSNFGRFKKARRLDKEVTYELDPTGLEYFAVASQLINLGAKNTNSRDYKKLEKIARELNK